MSRLVANDVMCYYCFDVLESHFNRTERPTLPFDGTVSCPMFVTLHKQGNLRGCIGTLSAKPLNSMHDYVYSSAFRDRRFEPLQQAEMRLLELSVSLLVEYEDAAHCYDWEVGKHGIIIELEHSGQTYSATYLPEVAAEQRWSKEECILSLLLKSGFKKSVSQAVLQCVKLTRYQSSKCSVTYEQYSARASL